MNKTNEHEYPVEVHLYATYEKCYICNRKAGRLKYEQINNVITISGICSSCFKKTKSFNKNTETLCTLSKDR